MKNNFENSEEDREEEQERNDSENEGEEINNLHINKDSGKEILIKNRIYHHLI
jgi:hypothetical protein